MNVFELKPNQELRLLVGEEPIKLELRRGLAEVYGTEMLVNKTYTILPYSQCAVFTYHGATIQVSGAPKKYHVSQMCDYMTRYLTIHGDLEKMRVEAEHGSAAITGPTIKPDLSKIPICIICERIEDSDSGKWNLCRILLNYATRMGRAPIFVDLDPDQGHIGLPGTIGALSIESPIDIETGLSLRSSMLMHFGHTSPSANNDGKKDIPLLFKALIENMANNVHSKLEQDKKSYYSGVIINTSSSRSDDAGYLVHACKAFKANVVLVLDHDDVLQGDLKKDLSDSPFPVNVLIVPKAGGLMTGVTSESNVELQYSRIKEYFYGTPSETFNPMTSEIKFSFLKKLIYRIGNPLMLPQSLMPLGTRAQDNQIQISQYECTASDLLHHILAISYCKIDEVVEDPEVVLRTNIMGFICITSVRADGNIVSILTPQKLPKQMDYVLLYSDIQYMD